MSLPSPAPASADAGVIGLAVMGQNLALNIADHGFQVAVYNRTTSVTEQMVAEHPPGSFGQGYQGRGPGGLVPCETVEDFVKALKRPRVAILLIKAGRSTDAVIDAVAEHLEEGDIIVDGGNAHWDDTARRTEELAKRGLRFIGSGVSGGETGARFGPSLMPGGDRDAWPVLEPIWQAISAKVDADTGKPIEGAAPGSPVDAPNAEACTAFIGPGAAGHYVKMVHNGIEYADMQLICEAYDLLRTAADMTPAELSDVFTAWNTTELDSFLIEITADILGQTDAETGKPFVDIVLDRAGQKGTGKWTAAASLDMGVPAPTIAEAVFARALSAMKDLRVSAAEVLDGPEVPELDVDRDALIEDVRQALYCSKICAYAQGFGLMAEASRENDWQLDFAEIAKIWRGGCIIRARLLHEITLAYRAQPDLPNLLMAPAFVQAIEAGQEAWRRVVAAAAMQGVPVSAFSSALSYFDSLRSARLPASLLQAQRDYFGAHTYERVDKPRGEFFHLDWPEPGRPELKM